MQRTSEANLTEERTLWMKHDTTCVFKHRLEQQISTPHIGDPVRHDVIYRALVEKWNAYRVGRIQSPSL